MKRLPFGPLRERIVHDEEEPCPYLDGRVARTPLRWQLSRLTPDEFDQSLASGDRRVGRMLYRTTCPTCTACEPIRVPVDTFVATRSQRRIWRRNEDISIVVGPVEFSEEKLHVFNRHKLERGLAKKEKPMTRDEYVGWFGRTCTTTIEMQYLIDDRIVGVGIVDVGRQDTSSVYYYFDPDEARRSLGTFSAMAEISWLRGRGGRFHYLGLYVADCDRLNYKSRFSPHERRIDGRWQEIP